MSPSVPAASPPAFLNLPGAAAAAVRAFDWGATPLGPPEGWPAELRAAAALALAAPFPAVLTWGADHRVVARSDAWGPALRGRAEGIGRPIADAWPEAAGTLQARFDAALAGDAPRFDDLRLALRDGGARDASFDCSLTPVRGADGRVAGVLGVAMETGARAVAEREAALASAAERARQRLMLRAMPGFAALLEGPEHRFAYVNDAYVALVGERGFIGRTVREVFPDIADQGFYELLDGVYASGERFVARALPIALAGDDGERFIDMLYEPVRDDAGAVTGIFVGGYDVTERVRAERVLARSEQRLLALARASSDVLYRMSPDWGEMKELDGGGFLASTSDPTRAWLMAYIPADEQARVTAAIDAAIRDRAVFDLEHRVLRADGAVGWTRSRAVPILGEDGAVVEWYGAASDVTARREAEELLRGLNDTLERQVADRTAALRLYRDIAEADASPVVAFDAGHRVTAFNRAHAEAFRRVMGRDARVGEVLPDLFPPDQAAALRPLMDRALAGETFITEEAFGAEGRERTHFEVSYAPLRDDAGRVAGAFHRARDVTAEKAREAELRAAQDALRQSQKMEAMGQLTGGVAHDFNNLLTPIVASLDMLQRRGWGTERERRLIGAAVQSADRAKTLVQRLLAFARRQPLQPTAVDAGALVMGMAELIASTTGPRISVTVEAEAGLPPARADANQLEMAVLNLAVNARDAMPDGGALRIGAAAESVGPGHRAALPPGRYVRLTVADTGTGMDAETAARAIEPFFSTKGVGRGTGLGLSMVHGLAAQLGGAMAIRTAPGAGTTVELWLPASAEEEAAAAAPAAVAPAAGGAGSALLVDDEEAVRLSAAEMLAELGFAVTEAACGEEALGLLRGGAAADVLVTDHLMPGMTGAELARRARALRPALPVLLVSGYAEVDGVAADLPRLSKPFRQAELAAKLAELLGGG